MRNYAKQIAFALVASCAVLSAGAQTTDGSLDPKSVVAAWSNASTSPKIIDINFSDETWPDTWKGETGRDCPSYADGGYVNAVIDVPANGGTTVKYPVLFHNCTFANKKSYGGYAGATAAFCRQYYLGEGATKYNDWKTAGHNAYLEDNIKRDAAGTPTYGEAGFIQMCRDAAATVDGRKVSQHGWMEIDHIPYVERIQWSWSSTSWGRGIKCDIKIGSGDWQPLVWMGSEKQKVGYTIFSDQGYFMENVINASDVSLRWRVWDGERATNPVQTGADGNALFKSPEDPLAQQQAPRVHKVQIFGSEITAEQAAFAKANPIGDVGTLSDLGGTGGGGSETAAPDDNAPTVAYTVAQDGTGDYTTVQAAIDAVPTDARGLIFIRKGIYNENIYAGTKGGPTKYISLIGESRDETILTSSVSRGEGNESNTYEDCAALNVYSTRFYAENLTIRNTAGRVGQAEALFTRGDAHIFKNCRLSGCQDTYKANIGARGYFINCLIEGTTDFIYDSGLEWFDNCEIRSLKGGSYVTAAGDALLTLTSTMYPELTVSPFYAGLFFRGCTLTAEEGVADASYYLGRPWKEKAGTMFIQCTLGNHIKKEGWAAWSGAENNCAYVEYKNVDETGNLVNTASRAAFSHQASDAEVAAYMTPEFMFAKASDVPFDHKAILAGAAEPTDFIVSDTEITWKSDANAKAYIIYKDGTFHKLTTEAILTKTTDDASLYTVSSVSRHGVTSDAVEAKPAVRLLAFPTAAGFGKYATGGRGGKVVTVTSLDDDGSKQGTLRWALKQHPNEPLTVVFAVSGQIKLNSELSIKRKDWTIAGQTAPGQGILISHNKVNVGGSENFIVRNIRFRVGQKDAAGNILADQAVGAENCSNFIFDHCNFGWSVEENMNTADSHFLTVQYSIVHEGLHDAGHHKGARGYGAQWGGSPATYHHNLLAHNDSRSPRINGARGEDYVVFMEYINNVNYNWGRKNSCYGGENTADIASYNGKNSAHECNFMNNYYKPGPKTPANSYFVESSDKRDGATSWGPAKWYINGNIMEGNATATSNNKSALHPTGSYTLAQLTVSERIVTETPYWRYSVAGNMGEYVPSDYMLTDIETAEEALATVIAKAGTVNRDVTEQRIAAEVEKGIAIYSGSKCGHQGVIDIETDAEGFTAYTTNYTVPKDTDGDGMPDAWESANGLNAAVADQNTLNADGYTALEVYLNSIMGETMNTDFTTGIASPTMQPAAINYDRSTSTLRLSDSAIGSHLTVYTTDGRLVASQTIASQTVSMANMPAGMLLVRIDGKAIAPRMVKIVK